MAKNLMYEQLPRIGANLDYRMFAPETKDSKDLSKNLVWKADSKMEEREEKRGCKGVLLLILSLVVAGLVSWLVAVTVLGHWELEKLKKDVFEMKSQVVLLKQKLMDRDIFDDVGDVEAVYAHLENKPWLRKKTANSDNKLDSPNDWGIISDKTAVLESIDDLEDMDDDDDDDDDEQSGWYDDEASKERIGHSDMVRLTEEDFLGTVLNTPEHSDRRLSKLSELRSLMKLHPDHVNADERKRKSRSVPEDNVDMFAAPRLVFPKPEERRKLKKYLVEVEQRPPAAKRPAMRTTRNSDDENTASKPFIAAHFHGNTSHLNPDIHDHYKGNGLVRVSHESTHDVWWPAPWTQLAPPPRPTLTRAGHVHVHHAGIYLVYVQIYYWDAHDTAGWVLHRTTPDTAERDTLMQCAVTAPSPDRREKTNSCFSAAALLLRQGDRLAVRNTGGDRHSLMLPEKSFFGLVKLADAEEPNYEL